MPVYDPPRNDIDRLAFLKRAVATGEEDIAAGKTYATGDTLNKSKLFIGEFAPVVSAVSEKSSERSKEVREKAEATKLVEVFMRDIWEVLKRRVNREDQPAEVLNYYLLTLDGTVPKPSGREALMTMAEQVVHGDADAVAAGFPAMVNPSAADLKARINNARTEAADVAGADRAYDEAQEAAENLREHADDLIDDIAAELRFNLRKKDPASRRRIMRTYGVKYRYLKGEPVEAD